MRGLLGKFSSCKIGFFVFLFFFSSQTFAEYYVVESEPYMYVADDCCAPPPCYRPCHRPRHRPCHRVRHIKRRCHRPVRCCQPTACCPQPCCDEGPIVEVYYVVDRPTTPCGGPPGPGSDIWGPPPPAYGNPCYGPPPCGRCGPPPCAPPPCRRCGPPPCAAPPPCRRCGPPPCAPPPCRRCGPPPCARRGWEGPGNYGVYQYGPPPIAYYDCGPECNYDLATADDDPCCHPGMQIN